MRGLCVLVMLECHSLILLSTRFDQSPLREWLNSVNGLVAPTFILCAGFALALVTVRSGGDAIKRQQRARRSIRRIGQVLGLGLFMRAISWGLLAHPVVWLWIDILSCIAYSLVMLWVLLFVIRLPARLAPWVFGSLAVAVFAVAPLVMDRSFGPVLTYFLNNSKMVNSWPLVPWSGYALLGAALGALGAQSNGRIKLLAGFGVVVIASCVLTSFDSQLYHAYAPASAYWVLNIGERLKRIGAIGVIFLIVERAAHRMPWQGVNPAARLLEFVSRYSLSAFIVHALLLFGGYGLPSLSLMAHRFNWPGYWAMVLMLETATILLCWGFGYVQQRWAKATPQNVTVAEPAAVDLPQLQTAR